MEQYALSQTAVQRFYRYHARVYDSTRWMILHGRRRAVERLRLTPASSVLEIGCGTGLNFRYVLDHLDPQSGRLTGLDFSADMLELAARRVSSRQWDNVELMQGDATTMSLGRRFDGILFAYSLTMIPDWEAALRRACEHLKPGGRLVVLDFGQFAGWGPLGPLMRAWLKANHVLTLRPYLDLLRELFSELEIHHWLGGYSFTAVGRRSSHA
jgi:S-adenosylmethionine-diacylgycerolhomoserine-N-methlytransferase